MLKFKYWSPSADGLNIHLNKKVIIPLVENLRKNIYIFLYAIELFINWDLLFNMDFLCNEPQGLYNFYK